MSGINNFGREEVTWTSAFFKKMYEKFSEAKNATETTQYNNCIVYYAILYIIKAFL